MARYLNYINGEWVPSVTKRFFKSYNPANTKEVIGVCSLSDKRDVSNAVYAAAKAFPKWKAITAPKRGEILYHAASLIQKEKKYLGTLVTREMGKVLKEGEGDVQEAADIGYYMAGEGRRLHGQTTPSELMNKSIKTVRDPVGVFGLITPWNFPIAIPAWKIFPALVCGNTVVFKPSQFTPVCAVALVKLFEKAGVPPGVLNLVLGTGSEAGDALLKHPRVNGISFTGSTTVGKIVGEHCGKTLKKHSLEMGGKNVIIGCEHEQSDWDALVTRILTNKEDWVVQRYVDIQEMSVPVLCEDGSIQLRSKKYNINPFVFGGKYAGSVARLSDQSVINVSAGGGLVPVMQYKEK